MRPKRSRAVCDERLLVVPARHVAAHRDRLLLAAELLRQRLELVLGARGQHDAVAELDGSARGGGADAGAGAGDHEDGSLRESRHARGQPALVTAGTLRARGARDPTEARFPAVPAEAGHYESFYLKPCHPAEPLGVWIRYTVHKRPGEAPNGSLWFTLFEPSGRARGEAHRARTRRAAAATGSRVGEARDGRGRGDAGGSRRRVPGTCARGRRAAALPPAARLDVPRAAAAHEAAVAGAGGALPGRLSRAMGARSRSTAGAGWSGHNWGAQHAERWIWLHGLTADGDWLDAAIGRVKIGPATTPVGRQRRAQHRRRIATRCGRAKVTEAPGPAPSCCPGSGVQVRGSVSAPPRALRRLGLRGSGRLGAPHRQLLDRRHDG